MRSSGFKALPGAAFTQATAIKGFVGVQERVFQAHLGKDALQLNHVVLIACSQDFETLYGTTAPAAA